METSGYLGTKAILQHYMLITRRVLSTGFPEKIKGNKTINVVSKHQWLVTTVGEMVMENCIMDRSG